MPQYKITWLDDKQTIKDFDGDQKTMIEEMSVRAGYFMGDCIKSIEVVQDQPQGDVKNEGNAESQGTGGDGNDQRGQDPQVGNQTAQVGGSNSSSQSAAQNASQGSGEGFTGYQTETGSPVTTDSGQTQ